MSDRLARPAAPAPTTREPAFPDIRPLPDAIGLHWQDRLRFAVVPTVARIARSLGVAAETLGVRIGRETLLGQARSIRRRPPAEARPPLRIVFATMMSGHPHTSSADAILALALAARGHDVRMVVCDQQLPLCEVKSNAAESHWARSCARCYGFGRRLFTAARLEAYRVSELLESEPPVRDPRWDAYAESALMKHYKAGFLADTPEVHARRDAFQAAAAVSAATGRAIIAMRPDRVLLTHGLYATWGPLRTVVAEAGVPVICYDKARKRYTEQFTWKHSSDTWDVSSEWERVKDMPLTADQGAKLDAYLATRRTHSVDTMVYNKTPEAAADATRAQLGLDASRHTAVIFTNVIWDGASVQREIVFPTPVHWVAETVEWYRRHPDRQLVVRVHPAELVIGTSQPFADLLRARVPDIPRNVRIIEPHELVNSWSLLHIADMGIVHTTTVGMELALEGTPCIIVSSSTYRGKGFTVDASTPHEYFGFLENPPQPDRATMVELARRFTYLLFERFQLPFPYLFETRHGDVRAWTFDDVDELFQRGSMQLICETIEEQGEFFLPA